MTRLTQDQASILTAYTGVLCGEFSEFHKYAEMILQRPIYTHEFAGPLIWSALKEYAESDFLKIAASHEDGDHR